MSLGVLDADTGFKGGRRAGVSGNVEGALYCTCLWGVLDADTRFKGGRRDGVRVMSRELRIVPVSGECSMLTLGIKGGGVTVSG